MLIRDLKMSKKLDRRALSAVRGGEHISVPGGDFAVPHADSTSGVGWPTPPRDLWRTLSLPEVDLYPQGLPVPAIDVGPGYTGVAS